MFPIWLFFHYLREQLSGFGVLTGVFKRVGFYFKFYEMIFHSVVPKTRSFQHRGLLIMGEWPEMDRFGVMITSFFSPPPSVQRAEERRQLRPSEELVAPLS